MKICIDLRFKKNAEGKLILQARWQPIQFSGTYAIQLSGEATDWQDVDLVNDVLPVEIDPVVGIVAADPVEAVKEETVSKEEKDAKMKAAGEKKDAKKNP